MAVEVPVFSVHCTWSRLSARGVGTPWKKGAWVILAVPPQDRTSATQGCEDEKHQHLAPLGAKL